MRELNPTQKLQALKEYELKTHDSDERTSQARSRMGIITTKRADVIASNSWAHGYAHAIGQVIRLMENGLLKQEEGTGR